MRRLKLRELLVFTIIGVLAAPAAADDRASCLREEGDAGIAACTRRIESNVAKPELVESLLRLVGLYDSQKRYADAESLVKRVIAIEEEMHGPDYWGHFYTLLVLADIQKKQRHFADAAAVHERMLKIREKEVGSNDEGLVQPLLQLAETYIEQNRYGEAEQLAKRALVIKEDLWPLSTLLDLYRKQKRDAEVASVYERLLAIEEKDLGPNHPDFAQSLINLATFYTPLARYADAEALARRALAIYEKSFGPDHPKVALALKYIALELNEQYHFHEAELVYQRLLSIQEKTLGPDHTEVAHTLAGLAHFHSIGGPAAEVEALYGRALAILEKSHGLDDADGAAVLTSLASLYLEQGRYLDAEPLDKRALTILEKAGGPDNPDVASPLRRLAKLYSRQGRYSEAELVAKRAVTILEKAHGPDRLEVAAGLKDLALIYRNQRRYDDAEPLYSRVLAISLKPIAASIEAGQVPLTAHIFEFSISAGALAGNYRDQGRYGDALRVLQLMIARGGTLPEFALPVLFDAESKGLIEPEEAFGDAFGVVQGIAKTSAAGALNRLAARLSAGTDELAASIRRDQDLANAAELLGKATITALSRGPSASGASAGQRVGERLAAIATERDALQKQITAEFPDYAALSNPSSLTTKDVQPLLSSDEALLVFSVQEKESFVFAETREGFAWKRIALGKEALAERVGAFRQGLDVDKLKKSTEAGKAELFDLGLAYDLYAALLSPVEGLIKSKPNLMVVPNGPLTALPFHLLLTERPTKAVPQLKDIATYRVAPWMMKRHAVSVLPSVGSLKTLRVLGRQDQSRKAMVGFGDPLFDPAERAAALAARQRLAAPAPAKPPAKPAPQARPQQSPPLKIAASARPATRGPYGDVWQGAAIDRAKLAQVLPSLLDTADELRAVAAKLGAPADDIHLAADASETTVKRTALADYRIVYFATHGLVSGDIKGLGEPALALTLPKEATETDDGLLTASEVAQLKLNADWVVLSACNTAAADKPGAEALSGLARAFFYAGARALLVSHWSVDSEAATHLTTATFEIMKSDLKAGRAEALRRAMLAYMNDMSSPLNAYPAFWAPFSVIGEGAAR